MNNSLLFSILIQTPSRGIENFPFLRPFKIKTEELPHFRKIALARRKIRNHLPVYEVRLVCKHHDDKTLCTIRSENAFDQILPIARFKNCEVVIIDQFGQEAPVDIHFNSSSPDLDTIQSWKRFWVFALILLMFFLYYWLRSVH